MYWIIKFQHSYYDVDILDYYHVNSQTKMMSKLKDIFIEKLKNEYGIDMDINKFIVNKKELNYYECCDIDDEPDFSIWIEEIKFKEI